MLAPARACDAPRFFVAHTGGSRLKLTSALAIPFRVTDMQRGRLFTDYEPVTRSQGRPSLFEDEAAAAKAWRLQTEPSVAVAGEETEAPPQTTAKVKLKRGHTLTYIALFLFTIILYARPAELYPSPWTMKIAFYSGVVLLLCYIPSQLIVAGTPTALPREVKLVLLFCLTALLSMPLAIDRTEAWGNFSDTFIRCVFIFIIMINVVRTDWRLTGLLGLALFFGCWLSLGALNDYRLGLMTVEGYRVGGRGTGIFGNSNDLALHLMTLVPIAVALLFASRSLLRKAVYGLAVGLMMAAIVLTYSRGAFLGMLVAFGFLVWKLGRRNRLTIFILASIVVVLFLALMPGNYATRLLSIFIPSLDPVGSSESRKGELFRSLQVAIRHPLFGIGMSNYATQMSNHGLVTHNAYTQVAAELGATALVIYTMFIVAPLRRLGQVARETFTTERSHSRYYYLSIGLQASLLSYMVASFFASVAYLWYVYYLVAYAVCLRRIYESETGKEVVLETRKVKKKKRREARRVAPLLDNETGTVTT
jgi:O-antigen ligase